MNYTYHILLLALVIGNAYAGLETTCIPCKDELILPTAAPGVTIAPSGCTVPLHLVCDPYLLKFTPYFIGEIVFVLFIVIGGLVCCCLVLGGPL